MNESKKIKSVMESVKINEGRKVDSNIIDHLEKLHREVSLAYLKPHSKEVSPDLYSKAHSATDMDNIRPYIEATYKWASDNIKEMNKVIHACYIVNSYK